MSQWIAQLEISSASLHWLFCDHSQGGGVEIVRRSSDSCVEKVHPHRQTETETPAA